jgi:hypothetical protein
VEHPTVRREPGPLLYSRGQLRGRERIYLRRRRDKVRFAAHVFGAIGLLAFSLWWVIPVHAFAGPVLVKLTPAHGVHVGDLPVLLFLCVAGWSTITARQLLRVPTTGRS